MDCLTIDPKTVDLDELIDRGTKVHGHLGPFLVVGIRLGLLALELLDSPGYFGLRAESDTGSITPLSCLTDGIQIGSGCTTGKGKLIVTDIRLPRARFTTGDQRSVEIAVREDAVATFRAMEIYAASDWTRQQPLEALFTWKTLSFS